jgi:hypothetical protein
LGVTASSSLYAGNGPAPPAGDVRDDILDGPVSGNAGLIHVPRTDLFE